MLKQELEAAGVKDDDEISYIDIHGSEVVGPYGELNAHLEFGIPRVGEPRNFSLWG